MKKTLLPALAVFILIAPFLVSAQDSPIKDVAGLQRVLIRIAEIIGYIFWIASTASAFYAGFLYLTASGETEKISKARRQIWYTVIAIVIALMATGLPALVRDLLTPK
jgi:hypothetical protein